MSALGSILAAVEERVTALLSEFTRRDDEQDAKLADLEQRVTALEGEKPAGQTRTSPTVAAKARGAQAGK
jgi:hypothetical protein